MDGLNFDFEADIESSHLLTNAQAPNEPPDLPAEAIGQQPANYRKNFRKTVCTYWLRGLCMKGDQCGFLHQFVSERMPVCRNLLKYGECTDQDCPYKHSLDEIKECNMYRLGFCIYGPACRYKHNKLPGPPPPPEDIEACKPRDHRNINVVVNQVNPGVARDDERPLKRPRPFDRDRDRDRGPLALPPAPGGPQGPGDDGMGGGGGRGGGRFDGGRRGRGPRDRDFGRGGRGGGFGRGFGRGGRGGGGGEQGFDGGGGGDGGGMTFDFESGPGPAPGQGPGHQAPGHQPQGQQGPGHQGPGHQGGAPLMPSVMAPGGSSSLPPMAGLLAPAMPNIMPGGGPGGPPPGAPPPFPQQGMFAPMQGFPFGRPF